MNTQENQFGCVDLSSEDELEKFLSGYDFLLTSYSLDGDSINAIEKIDEVRGIVLKILIDKKMSSELSEKFLKLHQKARFQAFGTERFFNSAPQIEEEDEVVGNVKPICVICKDDGSISTVNNAYIEATGIDTLTDAELKDLVGADLARERNYLKILKQLSTETIIHPRLGKVSKLYNVIYDEDNLKRVVESIGSLKVVQSYNKLFKMKLSKKTYLWSTLKNDSIKGNIRSAIEVDANSPLLYRLQAESKLKNVDNSFIPFGFVNTVSEYKQLIDKILLHGEVDAKLNDLFKKINEYSVIGETLINRSFYLVRGFDGENHYFNREFAKNTDLSVQDLMMSLRNGTFLERVYGNGSGEVGSPNIKDIHEHFKSLLKQKTYNYYFAPKKDGKRLNIEYVTSRYDDNPNTPENISNTVHYKDGKFLHSSKTSSGAESVYVMKTFGIGKHDR